MPWPKGRPAHNRSGPTPETYCCNKCGVEKPISAYHWKHNRRVCKECERPTPEEQRAKTLKGYGLTPETYMEMFEAQNFTCAICGGDTHKGSKRAPNFTVDHNHSTGKTRGILCHACNRGIGLFQDSPQIIQNAIDYLEKHDQR